MRRWNFKIFFNLGEGKGREKEVFYSIREVEILKFSLTMVKGKGERKSYSSAFEGLKF